MIGEPHSLSQIKQLKARSGISSQDLVENYPIGVQANVHEITDFATCVNNPFDYYYCYY